jgi:hypothetical protein
MTTGFEAWGDGATLKPPPTMILKCERMLPLRIVVGWLARVHVLVEGCFCF